MSFFSPATGREARALRRHLDSEQNRQAIAQRCLDPDYLTEVSRLREFHRNLYANIDAADIIHPQGGCPWVTSGLTAECERVADAYQVPIWNVSDAANSAAENCFTVNHC
jgi:hypothetical protein